MSLKLDAETWRKLREIAFAQTDKEIATMFRERNTSEVAHFSDDQLHAAIRTARQAAVSFGIRDKVKRMRFIMVSVLRLPEFWRDPTFAAVLTARTGTPDMRFDDVCAMIKLSAERTGKANDVWWS